MTSLYCCVSYDDVSSLVCECFEDVCADVVVLAPFTTDGVCVKGIVEPFDRGDGVLAAFLEDDVDARNGRESSLGRGAQPTWL